MFPSTTPPLTATAFACRRASQRLFMRSIATAFAFVLSLVGTTASASTVRYLTDAELIARADRIVHGRVIAQRATRGGPQGRSISTVTTIAVIEVPNVTT